MNNRENSVTLFPWKKECFCSFLGFRVFPHLVWHPHPADWVNSSTHADVTPGRKNNTTTRKGTKASVEWGMWIYSPTTWVLCPAPRRGTWRTREGKQDGASSRCHRRHIMQERGASRARGGKRLFVRRALVTRVHGRVWWRRRECNHCSEQFGSQCPHLSKTRVRLKPLHLLEILLDVWKDGVSPQILYLSAVKFKSFLWL